MRKFEISKNGAEKEVCKIKYTHNQRGKALNQPEPPLQVLGKRTQKSKANLRKGTIKKKYQ